jgi:cytochrome c-type biogenesis protein CcmH/NrfG
VADHSRGGGGVAILNRGPLVRLGAAAVALSAYGYCLFAAPPPERAPALTAHDIARDIDASQTALAAGRYSEALVPTERLAARMPTQAIHFIRLARIRHALGDRTGEASAWEEVFRTSPTPSDACPMLGQVYDALSDQRRALDAYERCAHVLPDDPDVLLFLGRAYNAAGNAAGARRALEHALVLAPEYPDLHLLLGVREFADGRVVNARRRFERFLELAPERRAEVAVWLVRVTRKSR